MTARSDAGTGTPPATGFNIELERLIIRYDVNDYLKVSFGATTRPSIIGIRNTIAGRGCKPASAGRR